MKIAFYRAQHGRIMDRAISIATNSVYSHCEIVFSDGMCASSSPRDGGVRFKKIDLNSGHWDVYDILYDYNEREVRDWFKRHEHEKYDWFGAFFSLWEIDFGWNGRKFCSESCAVVLGLRASHHPASLRQSMLDCKMIQE